MISASCLARSPGGADDLDDLVRRCRSGDLDAFDALIARTHRVTYGLACRLLGDRDAAEDATQEIYLKAWRGLSRFRDGSRFTTWLHAIAVRHCIDVSRARKRDASRSGPSLPEDLDGLMLDRSDPVDWDLAVSVHEALDALPEKLRVVVALHYFAGCTVEEIASSLGKHPNTIYHRLQGAMARLKTALSDREAPR